MTNNLKAAETQISAQVYLNFNKLRVYLKWHSLSLSLSCYKNKIKNKITIILRCWTSSIQLPVCWTKRILIFYTRKDFGAAYRVINHIVHEIDYTVSLHTNLLYYENEKKNKIIHIPWLFFNSSYVKLFSTRFIQRINWKKFKRRKLIFLGALSSCSVAIFIFFY